ncbi:hypothetical protein C8R45DRAFT_937996 [Mycena sanguinolenta]|nr:hypothetical protein C8R45DRAFT_937996 [Mycena sanguinolenta]
MSGDDRRRETRNVNKGKKVTEGRQGTKRDDDKIKTEHEHVGDAATAAQGKRKVNDAGVNRMGSETKRNRRKKKKIKKGGQESEEGENRGRDGEEEKEADAIRERRSARFVQEGRQDARRFGIAKDKTEACRKRNSKQNKMSQGKTK